jgi:hypothetical protein
MRKKVTRSVVKSVKLSPKEFAKIEGMFSEGEDFSKYARPRLLRIRPPRKFDYMRSQIHDLTDEILKHISTNKIDLEVLKKLQDIEKLLEGLADGK